MARASVMAASVDRPSTLTCGHCGASTALSWVPTGGGVWEGLGRCPRCGFFVCSYVFEQGASFSEVSHLLNLLDAESGSSRGCSGAAGSVVALD